MSSVMLDAALEYAARGWHVFPLGDHTKIPLKGSAGLHDATVDRGQINHWWTRTPTANVAISCGPSGLLVIDVDSYKQGADVAQWVAAHPALEETMSVRTGSGGMHYYFLVPKGLEIGNGASKVHLFVDHKAWGGYVLAPPSITDEPYELVNDGDPLPLPWPLREAIHKASLPPKDLAPVQLDPNSTLDNGVQQAFHAWVHDMAAAQDGERNHKLYRIAYSAGRHVAAGRIPEKKAREAIIEAARSTSTTDSPFPDFEIENTFRNGFDKGLQSPKAGRAPATQGPSVTSGSAGIIPEVMSTRFGAEPPPPPLPVFWHGRLVVGAVNLLAGTGGLGKSFIALKLAVDLARGEGYIDDPKLHIPPGEYDHGSTFVISYEDTDDDMKRRLWPLGWRGDGTRGCIEAVDGRTMFRTTTGKPVEFEAAHVEFLVDHLRTIPDLRMVVIDPVMSFIGSGVDTNQDGQVRKVLAPLVGLARELNVAVVAIAHTRKGQIDWTQPADSISGSVGFKNLARSVLMALEDPKHTDCKYVFQVKTNHTRMASAMQYYLEDLGVDKGADLHWVREVPSDFLRVLAGRIGAPPERLCLWWVEAYFANHCPNGIPVRVSQFVEEGTKEEVGWTRQQLREAFDKLHGIREKTDDGTLWLRLPEF